jgi:DNA-directed RNA polymerase subunit N (RpoN/RPB10)
MVFPILCAECGKELGSKYEFIEAVKLIYFNKTLNDLSVRVNKLNCDPDVLPPIGFILDAAGFNLICCRKTALTYMEFEDIDILS